jgi:fructose-1,6-bisphosphatase
MRIQRALGKIGSFQTHGNMQADGLDDHVPHLWFEVSAMVGDVILTTFGWFFLKQRKNHQRASKSI